MAEAVFTHIRFHERLHKAPKEIIIALPEERAVELYRERYGYSPSEVWCECCGPIGSAWEVNAEEVAEYLEEGVPFIVAVPA